MTSDRTDAVLQALADATRRDIMGLVLQDEYSVSALARRYPMSFAAVQKHVAVLERAGLISKHRTGREQRVRGEVAALRAVQHRLDQIEALWRGRMDRIDDLLARPDAPSTKENRDARNLS
jgi:DNA-binding transcriptional ArsR family regulator